MHVAILYSLPTRRVLSSGFAVTDTDTEESAKKIFIALENRVSAKLFPIREDAIDEIKKIHADVIVNLIEWDGIDLPLTLKAFDAIASTKIPLAGATKKNYETTTDKLLMKKALDAHHVPAARWQAFYTGNEQVKRSFHYPLIVKLSKTHCSVGLDQRAVVYNDTELVREAKSRVAAFKQPVIAEEFIDGREFQVTLLERADGLSVFPPAEIFFDKDNHAFLTFNSRWNTEHPDYKSSHIRQSVLDRPLQEAIETESRRAFHILKFRDYARFDIRVRSDHSQYHVVFLETNSNPGLDDDDEYGMTISYKSAGLTFSDFLVEIIGSALRRKYL